jgi:hypothetical protein
MVEPQADTQALGGIERLLWSHPTLQQAAFSGITPVIAKELNALGLHDVDPLTIARLGALTIGKAIDDREHHAATHIPPAIGDHAHHASTHIPPAIGDHEHNAQTHIPPAIGDHEHNAQTHIPPAIGDHEHHASTHVPPAVPAST